MSPRSCVIGFSVTVSLYLAWAIAGDPEQSPTVKLEQGVESLIEQIVDEQFKNTSFRVKPFDGDAGSAATLLLIKELKQKGYNVTAQEGNNIATIEGSLDIRDGKGVLKATLILGDDSENFVPVRIVIDPQRFARNVFLQPFEKFEEALKKPPRTFAGGTNASIIRAARGSPFGMEILPLRGKMKKVEMPLPVKIERNFAYFSIPRKNPFRVRIHNNSGKPVGCELLLDGINSLAFSTFKKSRGWVIPNGFGDITGWHEKEDEGNEFVRDFYNDRKVKHLRAPNKKFLGTIWANFYDTKKLGGQNRGGAEHTKTDRIGKGRKLKMKVQVSEYQILFGKYLGSVAIRYRD